MFSNKDDGTEYRSSGTIWNDALIPNESFKSISCGQKRTPAVVSTSCVIIAQLRAPSGQNQTKGTLSTFQEFMAKTNNRSKTLSTVRSTGQLGNRTFSQPRK